MSTSNTVGDLFNTAGRSLVTLSELIKSLHPTADSTSGGKWTGEDVEMLQTAVLKFCEDLNIISQNVKRRSVSQIRSGLKKKAYEDAGLQVHGLPQQQQQGGLMKSSEVTLNMLNAQESLVDVEGMHEGVKLEFGTSHHEEVVS
ncbi:SANT [Nesidiocoris tenuis]|nr:SANT [Nesidiocoris tenuis]